MESFFSRYKNALVLMLVVLAQVVLLAMQVRRPAPNMADGHNIRLWRYWVASVVTPPEKLAHGIGLRVRGVWSNYINLRNLREQNENLRDENTRLRLEQASLAEDAREGQRLREMLDFRAAYIDTTVPAQVIGTSGTDQAHVLYIDKGSKDGIRPQMPVITPDGVVGKVKNVFPGTSQVLLISDQTSGAGVMLQTTRIRGVLKGSVSGQPQIINISPDERIQPGEVVLTSGGDQVYPRGLPVGVVEKVVPDPETSYVNVVVKPNANLQKLEEVMVITQVSDKMPFGEEKDMMQSEVDAYAEKQRAADILSEKLPSLRNAETAESAMAGDDSGAGLTGAAATEGGGDPARPMRPPQALHPDRYTPGAAPAASELMPGQGPAMKYPSAASEAAASEAAAPKSKSTSATGSGTTGADGSTTGSVAVPKSRFPAKPGTVAPAAANGAGVVSSANGASGGNATATKSTTGVASTAGSGVTAGTSSGTSVTKAATRPTGSGFVLPLRPAYPSTGGASAGAGSANSLATGGGSTVVRTPRPATVAPTTGANTSTATGAATGTHVGTGSTPAAGTLPSRRIETSSDNGGILTPAGMGSIVSTPRPRPATPTGGAGAAGATTTTTAKPAMPRTSTNGSGTGNGATTGTGTGTPRPQTAKPPAGTTQQPAPKPQALPRPQAPPPGGF